MLFKTFFNCIIESREWVRLGLIKKVNAPHRQERQVGTENKQSSYRDEKKKRDVSQTQCLTPSYPCYMCTTVFFGQREVNLKKKGGYTAQTSYSTIKRVVSITVLYAGDRVNILNCSRSTPEQRSRRRSQTAGLALFRQVATLFPPKANVNAPTQERARLLS